MFSQAQLKNLNALCLMHVSDDGRTHEGTTEDGKKIVSWYKGKGNYDISVDGKYVGTVWYS